LDASRTILFTQTATSALASTLTFTQVQAKILYFTSGIIAVSETVIKFYMLNFADSTSGVLLNVVFDATSSTYTLVGLVGSKPMQAAADFYVLMKYITGAGQFTKFYQCNKGTATCLTTTPTTTSAAYFLYYDDYLFICKNGALSIDSGYSNSGVKGSSTALTTATAATGTIVLTDNTAPYGKTNLNSNVIAIAF